MKLKLISFFFFLFLNQWLWVIHKSSAPIFVFLILYTIFLYLSLFITKPQIKLVLILLFTILSVLYIKSTIYTPLGSLNSTQQDIQLKRLTYYPLHTYRISHFLETSQVMLSIYQTKTNLINVFDPNYYFFASFPRASQIPGEFSKFPSLYLIPFIIGLLIYFHKYSKSPISLLMMLSILLVAVFGDHNHLGIFILFPYFIIFITIGFNRFI
jgi:hypothetical protein